MEINCNGLKYRNILPFQKFSGVRISDTLLHFAFSDLSFQSYYRLINPSSRLRFPCSKLPSPTPLSSSFRDVRTGVFRQLLVSDISSDIL